MKASTDISWGVILEFFGSYYGSLRGEIDVIFELNVSINPFEDGDVDHCQHNIDNTHILEYKEEDMDDFHPKINHP